MEVVRDGWMLDAAGVLKVKTTDFADRVEEGEKEKKGIKNDTTVVGLKMQRMTFPSTEEGNINGGAVSGEEEKRGSVFPSGTW